jgi:hypothetical protein
MTIGEEPGTSGRIQHLEVENFKSYRGHQVTTPSQILMLGQCCCMMGLSAVIGLYRLYDCDESCKNRLIWGSVLIAGSLCVTYESALCSNATHGARRHKVDDGHDQSKIIALLHCRSLVGGPKREPLLIHNISHKCGLRTLKNHVISLFTHLSPPRQVFGLG